MSGFTSACQGQATAAWKAAGAFPEKYSTWKKEPSLGGRAQRGCLGFLIFGIIYVIVPLMVFLAVEAAIVAYALLLSALWGVGAVIDSARHGSGSVEFPSLPKGRDISGEQAAPATTTPEGEWRTDPNSEHIWRWWDGQRWGPQWKPKTVLPAGSDQAQPKEPSASNNPSPAEAKDIATRLGLDPKDPAIQEDIQWLRGAHESGQP